MIARIGFLMNLLIGLALLATDSSRSPTFAEMLILTSAAALLVLTDGSTNQRRTMAIERFLTRICTQQQNSKSQTNSLRLSVDDHEGDTCSQRLRKHLERVVGERHPKSSRLHHDHVRDLIAAHLTQMGWDVRLESVTGPHGPGHNVIAEKRGWNEKAGIVIVGAHYDTVQGTPGADDNGIAVAGILTLSELLRHRRLEHTIRLVAWDLEEQQGWGRCLLGSRAMARNIVRAGENVAGVICLEMIGMCDKQRGSQQSIPGLQWLAPDACKQVLARQQRGDFIATVANKKAAILAKAFSQGAASQNLPLVQIVNRGFIRLLRDLRRSDHAPFWDAGIPAIMVTDTSNFRSPFYHTAMDRIEMIDFEFAEKVVMSVAECIDRLERPDGNQRQTSFEKSGIPLSSDADRSCFAQSY